MDWQTFYHANRHKPLNKVIAEYNYILLEFNQKLQLESNGQPAMMSTPAAVGGAGPSGNVLKIHPSALTGGYLSQSYTQSLSTTGGYPPYTYAVTNGSLPAGLTLDSSTGLISGVALDAGNFSFTITVSGRYGDYTGQLFTISVTPESIIITGTFSNGQTSASYTGSAIATGGEGPYTYTLTSGSLPLGSTLNSTTGIVSSSMLTGEGTYYFVIRATDNEGFSQSSSFSMSVIPNITITGSIPGGLSGSSYTASVYALGGVGPYTYTITSGSLPQSSSINDNSGIIVGNLFQSGSFMFVVKATDTGSYTGSGTFTINVN